MDSTTTTTPHIPTSKPYLSRNLSFQKHPTTTTTTTTSKKRKRPVPRIASVDDRRKLKIRKGLEDGNWDWLQTSKPAVPDLYIFAINELHLRVNGGRYRENSWVELTVHVYNNFADQVVANTNSSPQYQRVYETSQIVRYSSISFHTIAIPISKLSPNINFNNSNEAFLDIVIKPIHRSQTRATNTWTDLACICPIMKHSKLREGAGRAYLIPTKCKLKTSSTERHGLNDLETWNWNCYGYMKFNSTSLALPEPIALFRTPSVGHPEVVCIDCETDTPEEDEVRVALKGKQPINHRKSLEVQRKQPSSYTTVHKTAVLAAAKMDTYPAAKKKRRALKSTTKSSRGSVSKSVPPLASSSNAKNLSTASSSTNSVPAVASSSTSRNHSTTSSTTAWEPVWDVPADDSVDNFPEECRGRFFAAGTFEPITSFADIRYEMEINEDWRIALGEYNLNDFADLSLDEKKLLNCWNRHHLRNSARGQVEVPRWVLNFAKENKDTIRPIRMEFCRLLTALVSLGRISAKNVLDALRYIDT